MFHVGDDNFRFCGWVYVNMTQTCNGDSKYDWPDMDGEIGGMKIVATDFKLFLNEFRFE